MNINQRLNEIKIEDYIWVIYIGIIILSFYSNHLEKDYFLNNNIKSKDKYREILIIIFLILLIIYLYYFIDSYNSFKNNKDKEKEYKLFLSLVGSSFILISGVIFLYLALIDEDLDVELAFN